MAKTVLGRGLGELLNDGKSARGNGVGTLARGQHLPPAPPAARLPRQRLLKASLLATDAVLTAGALGFCLRRHAPDGQTTAVCALAVLLGAWLGWCALMLVDREP